MSIQAAKEELNSLTDFQKEIHVTSSATEDIMSNFYKPFIKSTWNSNISMKLKCSNDGHETVYTANNSFHFLIYTYMRFQLPKITVNEKYKDTVRVAWCHNVGTNIINQTSFKEDDEVFHTWDNTWADIYFQFYQKIGEGKRDNHNIGIGNIECLENWSTSLPEYYINVQQPWFYSEHVQHAFPLFYKGSQTRAEHRYVFRNKISELLRVQILENGEWKDTIKKIHKYISVRGDITTINTPELWGRYSFNTETEIKWLKSCSKDRTYYTKDIEICDIPNTNRYKTISEVNLQCNNPCLAMFWVAQNNEALSLNNYSNYTTDSKNLYNGWDPIKTTTLKYGTTYRLDNMASDHFNIAESRNHFSSSPNERGYHAYSFANDSTAYDGDTGVVFSGINAKLQCLLENGNIFLQNESTPNKDYVQEEDESQTFITRVRLLFMRKVTIKVDDEGKFRILIK